MMAPRAGEVREFLINPNDHYHYHAYYETSFWYINQSRKKFSVGIKKINDKNYILI